IEAPARPLTVAMNVVNAAQLSRYAEGNLGQALSDIVPGLWVWQTAPTSLLAHYGSIRGTSSFGASYPKVYVDGIELANPLLVTQFTPETIDRIEVIRGPQGSALYGTDAISGVVNIVTRHEGSDADGSHTSVRTSAGLTHSAFARNALALEHALSYSGGSSTQSFGLNVTGGSIGDFIPNGYSKDILAAASARVVGERTTFSGTARLF